MSVRTHTHQSLWRATGKYPSPSSFAKFAMSRTKRFTRSKLARPSNTGSTAGRITNQTVGGVHWYLHRPNNSSHRIRYPLVHISHSGFLPESHRLSMMQYSVDRDCQQCDMIGITFILFFQQSYFEYIYTRGERLSEHFYRSLSEGNVLVFQWTSLTNGDRKSTRRIHNHASSVNAMVKHHLSSSYSFVALKKNSHRGL